MVVILACVYLRQNYRMRIKAKECAKEAQVFHEKLQKLSDPSRFFTDEEVKQLKREVAPLVQRVSLLFENIFISNDYLVRLGLKDFLEERKIVNHKQYTNNKEYNKRYYNK